MIIQEAKLWWQNQVCAIERLAFGVTPKKVAIEAQGSASLFEK